jgi:L-fucose isomerase-like protein
MTTLGVFIGNRGFFPGELCREGRSRMLKVLEEEGFKFVVLPADATPYYGAVVTYEESKKCAELFKAHREEIDGILVTLPNFGEERAIADTIRLAGLDVPVLVHAYPDDLRKMDLANRRDSFCGKMSACNNLTQYNIAYTLTTLHTVDPEDASFRQDLRDFGGVCRVVKGLRHARFGQVGARPAAFITVRYSEKLLEEAGISVESIDLSEILAAIGKLGDNDAKVLAKIKEIKAYLQTKGTPDAALTKQAKLGVALDEFIATHELVGTAVQCWTSIEENYGIVPCTTMSMLSNKLVPSACETDITGLVGMYAMVLASGKPSALLDWNNNFGDDPDKAVVFHCSNLPQDIFGNKATMDYQAIIAGAVGKDNAYGTVVGQMKPTTVTYCRVSTDDYTGTIRAYLGEADITDDPVNTFGGYGVIEVPAFQDLLQFICENGYEHHVALNPAPVADILYEAMDKYLGWDVYYHQG